jgi:hypothetical protein
MSTSSAGDHADPAPRRRVDDVGDLFERQPDGDQRSAAQAGGSPFDEQVKVRIRCCTGRILLLYWHQDRPSPILVRASDAKIPFVAGALLLPSGLEGDLVAHPAELFDGAVFGFVGVESGVEVCTRVVVEGAVGAHVPDRGEYGVLDRDDCFDRSASGGDAPVLGPEVGRSHVPGCVCEVVPLLTPT